MWFSKINLLLPRTPYLNYPLVPIWWDLTIQLLRPLVLARVIYSGFQCFQKIVCYCSSISASFISIEAFSGIKIKQTLRLTQIFALNFQQKLNSLFAHPPSDTKSTKNLKYYIWLESLNNFWKKCTSQNSGFGP